MAYIVPIVIAAKRNQVLESFKQAGATRPDTARSLEELGMRRSSMFRSLCGDGVIRAVGDSRYYLDLHALEQQEAWRHPKALVVLPLLFVIALVIYLLSR